MKIPLDYETILSNRVIIVTGAGRSGTTILGKLIGSMDPAFYFFEPTIVKFGYMHCDLDALRAIFVEDFVLPLIQGRNINSNDKDDSYIGNYEDPWTHLERRKELLRRDDALEWIERVNPKFVIKLTDFTSALGYLRMLFPGVRVVNIIRNPNDVIGSAIKRGWFTDDWLQDTPELMWCPNEYQMVAPIPWYIQYQEFVEYREWGAQWTPITRAACAWRIVVSTCKEGTFGYNDLIFEPDKVAETFSELFFLKITDITKRHIKSIKNHKRTKHDNVIKDIQEPERKKVLELVHELEQKNIL